MRSFEEVKEALREMDELALLDLLSLTSEEIVAAFSDKIEDNFEKITKELNDE